MKARVLSIAQCDFDATKAGGTIQNAAMQYEFIEC
jgi:hypothetical protein